MRCEDRVDHVGRYDGCAGRGAGLVAVEDALLDGEDLGGRVELLPGEAALEAAGVELHDQMAGEKRVGESLGLGSVDEQRLAMMLEVGERHEDV